jgi:hypothetical protein
MHSNPKKFDLSLGLLIAVATSIVAMNSIVVGATCPPPPFPAPKSVTINVATNPTSYTVGTVKAYRLKILTCETVTWTVSTPPNSSGKNPYHVTILFPKETPLFDPNTNLPAYLIVGSDQTPISAMAVDADATGNYEYYVVVVDDFTKQTYPDDPKIIVGTGKDSASADISSALHDVEAARAKVSKKLQEQMKSIETQLCQVLDALNDRSSEKPCENRQPQ